MIAGLLWTIERALGSCLGSGTLKAGTWVGHFEGGELWANCVDDFLNSTSLTLPPNVAGEAITVRALRRLCGRAATGGRVEIICISSLHAIATVIIRGGE